ncbi:MAG: adenosylcobinamide-GDP ribazoletransferase [Candidatus Omnitrophota bacterium]
MKGFLLAVQFLTVIPLKIKDIGQKGLSGSAAYFPLAGLFIGLLLLGVNFIISALNAPILASSIILIVSLVVITGGMHLDGLCDSADAFLSGKPKEEMLDIMRDPRAGSLGVLSLVCVILLKIGLLYSIGKALRPDALILMCVLSRWSMVFSLSNFAYARKEGKARAYMRESNPGVFFRATAITLAVVLLSLPFKGLLIWAIVAAATYLINRFISKKIGGLTGDTIGATSEISETLVLFSCFAIQ